MYLSDLLIAPFDTSILTLRCWSDWATFSVIDFDGIRTIWGRKVSEKWGSVIGIFWFVTLLLTSINLSCFMVIKTCIYILSVNDSIALARLMAEITYWNLFLSCCKLLLLSVSRGTNHIVKHVNLAKNVLERWNLACSMLERMLNTMTDTGG